ncbi:PIN domain-containing protein [Candidatus Micrarchaeota archaeon]|nr:PIN domain-containing protein [Candidatus Micrarchaeota archaeon]
MIIIDTSVLVASVNADEDDYEEAVGKLNAATSSGESQFITYGVLVELAGVLSRKNGKEFAAEYVQKVFENFSILPASDIGQTIEFFQSSYRKLSLVDCEVILASRQHAASVLSLDKELLKAL